MVYSNNFGQSRVGIRNRVVNVVNSVDADAIAFIAAAGITNLTQAAAINTLVNDLKTYGLWTKMKALYPMVGGTATSHKFNLKDPRDLDAAYRLVFNGGWTHTSTGVLPNGLNTFANTKLTPSSTFNTTTFNHLSYYSRTSLGSQGYSYDMGSYDFNNGGANSMIIRRSSNVSEFTATYPSNISYSNTSATVTDGSGLFMGTQNGSSIKYFRNNSLLATNTTASTNATTQPVYSPIFIGTLGEYGYAATNRWSNKECAFVSIGTSLTDTDAANFYNSVQKFQTSLGRQIGSPIVSDTDAQAFINAAGLTDLGQANAVNTLVVDLKAAGVWTKMKALYPFVGGTATTHKFNLKDPRDVDAAFRLVFNGGWTHTATGALPNGTTGYADTRLIPQYFLTSNNSHLSFYSRSNTAGANRASMGSTNSPAFTTSHQMFLRFTDDNFYGIIDSNTAFAQILNTNTTGYYVVSRTANNSLKAYKNSSLVVTNTTTITPITNSYPILISARNDAFTPMNYDNKESAFASIGDGLTDAEALAFYTAVQKYQTTLGRQIGTPVLAEGQTAGLLETYSGAAAAYSLRKLRTGYVGNAIRVRRSSDNAEQDIAFDASGNLDTTSLLAFVGSGNGFVTTWYDQSGFNNHITQTTAGNQPQIVSSGVVKLLNNKPSIYFDGSSTYFNSSTQTVLSTGGGGYSIFGTAKPSGTSGPKCLFYIGSASGNNGVGFNLSNTQPRHYWFANDYDTSQTFSDTNTIYAVSYDGSKRYTAINNVTQSQNATGKNTTSPTLMVGRLQSYGQFFIGLQSELIIYNSYKDTSITNIYGSMNSYYSIY